LSLKPFSNGTVQRRIEDEAIDVKG